MLAMYIVAGLHALWLWWGGLRGRLGFAWRGSPVARLFLGFVAWQLVVLAGVDSAFRMWFGNPEFGEGVGFYVAIALGFMVFCELFAQPRMQKILALVAVSAISTASLIHLTQSTHSIFSLSRWADEVGLMLLWVALGIALLWPALPLKKLFPALCGGALLLLALEARIAAAACLLAACGVLCFRLVPMHKTWRVLACVAVLAPLSFIAIAQADWGTDKRSSMGERARLAQVAVKAIESEPQRLLLGHGWGAFQDDVFRYSVLPDVHLYVNGKASPNTNLLSDAAHHTHNQALEALMALGVVGAGLWLSLWLVALWRLPEAQFRTAAPVLVGLVMVSMFWFPQANLAGFMAFGLAALVCATSRPAKPLPQAASLAFIPLIGVMFWAAAAQFMAMGYGAFYRAVLAYPYQQFSSAVFEEDARRGGDRFRFITNYLMNDLKNGALPENANIAGWVGHVFEASFAYAKDERSGPYVASTTLMLQNTLLAHTKTEAFASVEVLSDRFFNESLIDLARVAPLREDFAALQLYRLDMQQDKSLPALLDKLLEVAPDHRSALWLKGKRTGDKAMMQRALDLGAARVYPITDIEIDSLGLRR